MIGMMKMKVKEFIEILNEYDSEAQFEVVLNGCPKVFGFAYILFLEVVVLSGVLFE